MSLTLEYPGGLSPTAESVVTARFYLAGKEYFIVDDPPEIYRLDNGKPVKANASEKRCVLEILNREDD